MDARNDPSDAFVRGDLLPALAKYRAEQRATRSGQIEAGINLEDALIAGGDRSLARSIAAELLIDQEDRVAIRRTTAYPYRCICMLQLNFKRAGSFIGTGWLAGPRTIITAGHNLYIHQTKEWVTSVDVFPGRNGSETPFGSYSVPGDEEHVTTTRAWETEQDEASDYGAIMLNERIGDRIGFLGYWQLKDDELHGLTVNVVGYPGRRNHPSGEACTMWGFARQIINIGCRSLVYDAETRPDQSGSPLIRFNAANRTRYVVGIHNYGDRFTGNSATRIDAAAFANIRNWTRID